MPFRNSCILKGEFNVNLSRASGILLHPTSLPGRFGIGDLGAEAREFVDFLQAGKQTLWQVLPLGQTGYGDSPYQCFSAFAGNTLLISLPTLVDEKLLEPDELKRVPQFPVERVDFGGVLNFKNELLKKAFENFKRTTDTGLRGEFETFQQRHAEWLDDYALYRALKNANDGAAWNKWDSALVKRDTETLKRKAEELHDEMNAQKFYQFLFFRQWKSLRDYANERDIKIVGDIPIFVAFDSSDVWTQPEQFKLNADFTPRVVAGVPPDYFSKTGQLWGNPLYEWERMKADDFAWWTRRVRATLELVDIIRLDHFRGFAACWEVPGADETAERGRWTEAPGRELLTALKNALGDLPILAEDLGVITPDVESLRDDFNLPGMRILQFAFGGDANNHDLPHNYIKNCVVYTGTHDNDTTIGWYESQAGAGSTRDENQIRREREFCLRYLNSDGREIHWDFIRAVLASVSDIAIVPLQDVLGLGGDARMNLPASTNGNWNWRYREEDLKDEHAKRLRELVEVYGRNS